MNSHPLEQISFLKPNCAWVVEASAGTGKTWTIERLFIKALLEASNPVDPDLPISLENVLVVTFTNDATDELKHRIQEQIQAVVNQIIYWHNQDLTGIIVKDQDSFTQYLLKRVLNYDYQKDITVLSRALQNFDMAAIFTIHGFCKNILHDYQFDCAINSEFELAANRAELLSQLVLDFLRTEIINNQKLKPYIEIVLTNLEELFMNDNSKLTLAQRISQKLPIDLFIISNGKFKVKYKLNVTPSLNKLINPELNSEGLRECKAEFLAYLIEYISKKYPSAVVNQNIFSYDELIQKVADILIQSENLANKIYTAFPIAFIDEFQDTDALQWQIFNKIYRLGGERRGNVVVVGDPKQAIYRFRGADVDTYIEAKSQIANCLDLDSNFRSHPNIMNFINHFFDLAKQNHLPQNSFLGNGIEHLPIKAKACPNLELPSVSRLQQIMQEKQINAKFYDAEVHLVAIKGATKSERQAKLLAALTFEILALLHADPSLKSKIAILVTKNREAAEIVHYFRKYGLKAAELRLGNIFATQTATNLYQVLNSVVDLSNRKNFIQALSASLFNLPLDSLDLTKSENNVILEKYTQRFYNYKQVWDKRGVISLIYALINDILTDHPQQVIFTNRELANIWQLAELINIHSRKVINQTELIFWLKQKIKNTETNQAVDIDGLNEELIRLDNDDEQIIITTQHKAKGLEYEILFCPYFKNGHELDRQYDFNYRRPFFSNYWYNNQSHSALVMDSELGKAIVANDNKEAHRLNYVALTRVKSRLYIYLKQNTISKVSGKYNQNEKPDKLIELFGYVKHNPNDTSHQLFNYPKFFSDNPGLAIKNPELLPGVVAYNRDRLSLTDLIKLKLDNTTKAALNHSFNRVGIDFCCKSSYTRQSYSGLTSSQPQESDFNTDFYQQDELPPAVSLNYRYSILNDKSLRGATFGVLFHKLCESNGLLTSDQLKQTLHKYNIDTDRTNYGIELSQMLDEAFNYKLLGNMTLANLLPNCQHELEFNLVINNSVELSDQVAVLIGSYFGFNHPFSQAIKSLGKIETGFLVGFIDLFFNYEGKYWVLDYKTNTLDNYASVWDCKKPSNSIMGSMAEHHYYLQYLLYLVAIKRYIEKRLHIADAADLIGGAIYYYVRGIYIDSGETSEKRQGIYLDNNCQDLVRKMDELFKGQVNA